MKKVLFVIISLFVFYGCVKDDANPVSVPTPIPVKEKPKVIPVVPAKLEVSVSFFYNDYQGYRKDVDSKAYLFKDSIGKKAYMFKLSPVDARYGMLVDAQGVRLGSDKSEFPQVFSYSGIADGDGKINISDIAPATYLLVVASKGRYVFSSKTVVFAEGKTISLVKNFGYLFDGDTGGESW